MLITLGLILLILIMVVGGDRGVVSLIALCGNLLILSLAIWLMASGVPVLLVTVCVGVVISCITLFYQNGRNGKTWSAFLATMITMLLLFFFIYIVVWRSEAGGLNEIQQVGEDVFYYNRKRSDRNNGEYTSVCIFRRITSAFFLSADAGIFV